METRASDDDSRETFDELLADLLARAAASGDDVEGAYDITTSYDGSRYDVVVSAVKPNGD